MGGLLSIRDLTVKYGGVVAVDRVSLDIEPGSFVGLIGPNGAGKTTLIDAVTGLTPANGELLFRGAPIGSLGPDRRAREGIVRTFQGLELFEELTVRENLLVGAERVPWYAALSQLVRPHTPREASHAADSALEMLELESLADALPTDLSLGERKLVTVARALAAAPALMLLDEPAAGLDSRESMELGRKLRRIADRGVAVLLVDHDVGLVMAVCDSIYVLDFGKVIAHGSPSDIRDNERVVRAYLGDQDQAAMVLGAGDSA